MDDYNAMFILGTFNTIFFIITMRPLAMDPAPRAGGGGAVTRYVAFRRALTKSGAGMVGGGGKTPDLQPPEPGKAPGETVKPPETGAAAKPAETVPPPPIRPRPGSERPRPGAAWSRTSSST